MRTLFFYARGIGEYTDLLTTAKRLIADYEILIASDFPLDIYGEANIRERAEAIGCKYYDMSQEEKNFSWFAKCLVILESLYVAAPIYFLTVIFSVWERDFNIRRINRKFYAIYRMLARKYIFDKVLSDKKPLALVVNNVNGGTLTELLIVRARKFGIKSLLTPFTLISPIAPVRVLKDQPKYIATGLKLGFCKRFLPEWIYLYEGTYVYRKPFLEILTQKLLKAAPPLPWVQDSSSVDVMVVESMYMKAHYEGLGILHDNMQVAGRPNHDYLHSLHMKREVLASELYDELGFTEKKPFLLLAIPPRFVGFREKEGRASEFNDYEEIVAFLLDTVSRIRNFNVLVCLHPKERARLAEAIYMQDSLPGHVKYSIRDTAELMAVSELYVMAGSSTALWALALKIPVIDYDAYGFRFDFFSASPDVMRVIRKQEFQELLLKIDENPDFLADKKARLDEKGDYYGLLDGQSVERIKRLINS